MTEIQRILLLYTDRYYLVKQVYPFGLDLIARFLRGHGYRVDIAYPFLPEPVLERNLETILENARPDLVGLGIRNLDTCMSCEIYGDTGDEAYRTLYFLPEIRRLVQIVKRLAPGLPIIAGGGGFTISPEAILVTLGIEYGIVGEGETSLLKFVKAYPDKDRIRTVPGLVWRSRGRTTLNRRRPYRFEMGIPSFARDGGFTYAFETTGLPVLLKRGCNQQCSYCVEPIIEGRRFVFRELDEVVRELKWVVTTYEDIHSIFFVDTEFNLPDLTYCTQLMRRILDEGLHKRLRFTSQFLPRPFDPEFAALLSQAGFSVILTGDSFSNEVLEKNRISYREEDIIRAIELCETHGIPCTVAMIFGLPGETDDSVGHSLGRMKQYPAGFLRQYEYTVGGRVYERTPLCRWVEKEGCFAHIYGNRSIGYLDPYYFCTPRDPLKLNRDIERELGHRIARENPLDPDVHGSLALAFMMDREQTEQAVHTFLRSPIAVCLRSFDYLFRKLSNAGRSTEARTVCDHFINRLTVAEPKAKYLEQIEMVRFYRGLIGS